jgi:hypothetical protein
MRKTNIKQKDTNHKLKAKKHRLPIVFILIFWITYVQTKRHKPHVKSQETLFTNHFHINILDSICPINLYFQTNNRHSHNAQVTTTLYTHNGSNLSSYLCNLSTFAKLHSVFQNDLSFCRHTNRGEGGSTDGEGI